MKRLHTYLLMVAVAAFVSLSGSTVKGQGDDESPGFVISANDCGCSFAAVMPSVIPAAYAITNVTIPFEVSSVIVNSCDCDVVSPSPGNAERTRDLQETKLPPRPVLSLRYNSYHGRELGKLVEYKGALWLTTIAKPPKLIS